MYLEMSKKENVCREILGYVEKRNLELEKENLELKLELEAFKNLFFGYWCEVLLLCCYLVICSNKSVNFFWIFLLYLDERELDLEVENISLSEILYATRERNIELSILNENLVDKVFELEMVIFETGKKVKMLEKKLVKVKDGLKKVQKKYVNCLKFTAKFNKS